MARRYTNVRWLAILLMAAVWLSSDDDSSFSTSQVHAFAIRRLTCSMTRQHQSKENPQIMLHALGQGGRDLRDEAEDLLTKARELREQIGATDQKAAEGSKATKDDSSPTRKLQWSVKDEKNPGDEYRLYIDIGREEGTWMERRWGASGRRIPFSLDIRFLSSLASDSDAAVMVKDNYMGKSSACYSILTADAARLRDGFEKMVCNGGCYRIDSAQRKDTVRFYLNVDGTNPEQDYGDISIPEGRLYFSLPCFGARTSQLSTKEGLVTVRQIGWNTGWRREESRIVGTFHARPIETARQRDGF